MCANRGLNKDVILYNYCQKFKIYQPALYPYKAYIVDFGGQWQNEKESVEV
jgi:hypothetical protein